MSAINEINYLDLINFINLPTINDQTEESLNVDWIIDRTPDNNVFINDNHIEYHVINNNNLQTIRATDTNLDYTHPSYDEFIPFEPQNESPNESPNESSNYIVIEAQEFPITEEDCDCCICMDTRENDQICQFNCLHKFCVECILTHYRRNRQQTLCPLCRIPVTNIYLRTEDIRQTFI